jgi:hypothetical protein
VGETEAWSGTALQSASGRAGVPAQAAGSKSVLLTTSPPSHSHRPPCPGAGHSDRELGKQLREATPLFR